MKNNIWNFLKPIIVLTLIAAVMAGLLGGTNLLTTEKIKTLEAEAEKAAVEKVIKAENYNKFELSYNDVNYAYFKAQNGADTVGYAFSMGSNGYGGTVKCVIGIDISGKITAVEITDVSNETPGLGQNAGRASFTDQFKGKSAELSVVKSGAKENEIQAITGATITSKAVANSVNLAMELYKNIEGEGN